ncbi:MAG: type II secretion system F family protein [Streptosporangiaceae bacterium]
MKVTRAGAVLACAGALLMVTAASAAAASATGLPASRWHSPKPDATKSFGTSKIRNNVTCPCGGHQQIWANSGSNWGVYTEQASSNNTPVSYPDVQVLQYNFVSSIPILQGWYNLSQPPVGNFVAAYDISIQNKAFSGFNNPTHIMVWVDNHGETPQGTYQTSGDVYGKPFRLYSTGGKLQAGATYTLVFQQNSPSGKTHLAKTFTWLKDHGWISGGAEDLDVEFGWQISSTNGTYQNFEMKSFSLYQRGSSPYSAGIAPTRLPLTLIAGLAAVALAVFGLALLLMGAFNRAGKQRSLNERIERYGPRHRPVAATEETENGKVGGAAVDAVTRLMAPAAQERLGRRLDLAGIGRKPAEWVLLGGCLAVAIAAAVSLATSYVLIGVVVGALVGWLLMRLSLSMRILRRRTTFAEQLPDLLQLIASSLQSGFSLPQAFDAVVREDVQPAAGEFSRALAEARLGAPLEDALDAVATRMDSDDLRWTVLAIRIQQGVGGNLAEVLLTIVSTIRERDFLRRQVHALSAEGRLSAYILVILPVLVAGWLFITSPNYMRLLYTTSWGDLMLIIAFVLLVIGALWMRKVIRVEV